jgi:hypothetical protein
MKNPANAFAYILHQGLSLRLPKSCHSIPIKTEFIIGGVHLGVSEIIQLNQSVLLCFDFPTEHAGTRIAINIYRRVT